MWEDLDTSSSTAGIKVDLETALTVVAVQSAIRLLVNDIASLPADALRKTTNGNASLPRPSWMSFPAPLNVNLTWEDHIKQVVFSLLTDGNAFVYCLPSVSNPTELRVLKPTDVSIETAGDQSITYKVPKADRPLTGDDILHIPWVLRPGEARGMNPIAAAEESLGIAIAADRYVGGYFGNGATLSGLIKFPTGSEPAPAEIERLKKDFTKKHVGAVKSHAVGALTGGAEWQQIAVNNRDAQLLELREHIVEDVARLFGIPPHMLGSQRPGAVSYASVEQRSLDYTQHAVLPIVSRIERGYRRLFRGQDDFLKFNLNGLLRADSQSRATFYREMLQNKVMPREEVRELEDLKPLATAVGFLETPNNNAADPRFEAVGALIRAGFDPNESLAAVGLPPITHTGKLPVTVQSDPAPAQEPAA